MYEAKKMPFIKSFKLNFFLKTYSFFKIPLIFAVRPKILYVDNNESHLMIPLNRKNKNHLNVMYFGALAIGAELAIALVAVKKIVDSKLKIDFLFKDFKSNFLKRADGDVVFVFREVSTISELIDRAQATTDRINYTLKAVAYVPSKSCDEVVAEFELTMSVKNRTKK